MRWMQWFGDDWERPSPAVGRRDVAVALAGTAVVLLCQVLARSFAVPEGFPAPSWREYAALAALFPVLLVRRRHPLASGLLAFAHFFCCLTWLPQVNQLTYQVAVFACLCAVVAWGRDRHATALVMGALVVAMAAWVGWDLAVGRGIDYYRKHVGHVEPHGPLGVGTAYVLYSIVVNIAFMAGAIAIGQVSWNQARDRAELARQAETIAAQADELRDRAVVDERLRIARELHDVVAHHVAVMGIQAAGARRLLERDPATAATALAQVEDSSRQAVTQMRSLLGALRGADEAEPSRAPQPTLDALPALLDEARATGLDVTWSLVEDEPGSAGRLPLPVQLSLFRTVQESLANVRRHSTARHASVTLRVDRDGGRRFAEVEVLDDGRPLAGTSGSGLGLLGMRERATSHGGTVEVGPRVTGGYRVRVRLPVPAGPLPPRPTATPGSHP